VATWIDSSVFSLIVGQRGDELIENDVNTSLLRHGDLLWLFNNTCAIGGSNCEDRLAGMRGYRVKGGVEAPSPNLSILALGWETLSARYRASGTPSRGRAGAEVDLTASMTVET